MAIQNISESVGFSPVEQVQSAIPVVPEQTGSSPVSSTGEGAFAPKVSSPVPGEVLPIQASNLSPQTMDAAPGIGDALTNALAEVDAGPEGAEAKNTAVTPQGGPASGKIDAAPRVPQAPAIEAPEGSVELPPPPAAPGEIAKPAETYKSVLSPSTPPVDNTVRIPPVTQMTIETPRGTYNSVLPAMAGAAPDAKTRTIKGYLTRNDNVAPAAAPVGSIPSTPAFNEYHSSIRGKANFFSSGRNKPPPGNPASAEWQSANLARFEVPLVDGRMQGVRVYGPAAQAFEGFLTELQASGYPIYNIGSQVARAKRDGGGPSEHSYGTAIDINGEKAPGEAGPRNAFDNRLITDLPSNISQMAAKYGLSWGGDWRGKKDAMHFEYTGTTPPGG